MASKPSQLIEAAVIRDIRINEKECRVSLNGVANAPGTAAEIFAALADGDINVNLIVQNMTSRGYDWADISLTVDSTAMEKVGAVLDKAVEQKLLKRYDVHDDEKILVVEGDGMQTHTDIASRIFHRLGAAGINIEMICTSELEISCAVNTSTSGVSLKMLKDEFKDEINSEFND